MSGILEISPWVNSVGGRAVRTNISLIMVPGASLTMRPTNIPANIDTSVS